MPTVHPQLQKARDLLPLIAAAADENDDIRKLTRPVVEALIDGGFFTMLKTKSVGGMELKPSIFAQVTEAIASVDGSTGWVVCQSNGCSTTSAYLDPHIAQEIFGRPDGIVAWGPPGSPYEATPVEGGYRITGKWRFMSGSQNATWLGAHLRVAGTKETKTFLYPKSSATFHDIWHTLGLRGTASNEYSVDNLFIPHERAIYRDDPRDRRSDSPLYRFTSNQLYSIGFGGVALGIARGTMDAFLALPREKTRRGAGKPMVENNVVQSHVAQSEARWRSARYFLHAAADEALETIEECGAMETGSAHPPAPRFHLGHSVVARDRQHAVSRLRLDGGVRGESVRTPPARHRHGRTTGPGADTALRDGRSGDAWPGAGEYFLAVDRPAIGGREN